MATNLYVTARDTGSSDNGLFKSTDGGTTWKEISSGFINNTVMSLTIDPVTPTTLYAGTYSGVLKSTDGGANWISLNKGLPTLYISSLAIDPQNPSRVYAGTDRSGAWVWSLTDSETILTFNKNPSVLGEAVSFTATVSPATATGSIVFKDGETILGTATLASGSATFTTSSLAVGDHTITATYLGDGNDEISTSEPLTQTVTLRTYTLTYTAAPDGTISGEAVQQVAEGGSGAAVMAVPNPGYRFVNWSDGSTANPRTDANVTADISVTASFEPGDSITFSGFFPPVKMDRVNSAKAGQIVAMKWRLVDENGVGVSDPNDFAGLFSTSCGDPSDTVREVAAGGSGLQYLGDGYWQFNWKTSRSYAGTCRDAYINYERDAAVKASPPATFQFK